MVPTICSHCGSGSIVFDPDISSNVCTSCGGVLSTDFYQASANVADSSFVANDFNYHQRKHYHAKTLIQDLASRLNLSSTRSSEVETLISDLTSSSFGAGDWFPVLAAAATYVVTRRHRIPLSLDEAAAAVGCDELQIKRMVMRILSYLDLGQLPDFDAIGALDRAIRTCSSFGEVGEEKKEELIRMGRFLIQCMMKWFLMTGRRPLPAVAAVAAFVAEVNGVEVEMGIIAKELYAKISTCKIRLRELKETLIKVARALLPWGKDVNLKNLVYNMPLLIRVMESKARFAKKKKQKKSEEEEEEEEGFEFNLDEYLTLYSNEDDDVSEYFKIDREGVTSCGEVKGVKISGERLLSAYKHAMDRLASNRNLGCNDNEQGMMMKKRKKRRELENDGWGSSWEGRWDSGEKLTLEQVLERDVGYDMLPPSYVSGVERRKRRRLKIDAAKNRINQTLNHPLSSRKELALVMEEEEKDERKVSRGRKRRKQMGVGMMNGIDWEDCIVEVLLLHQVDESEIEQGQYNRLLDLHVFGSTSSLSTQ